MSSTISNKNNKSMPGPVAIANDNSKQTTDNINCNTSTCIPKKKDTFTQLMEQQQKEFDAVHDHDREVDVELNGAREFNVDLDRGFERDSMSCSTNSDTESDLDSVSDLGSDSEHDSSDHHQDRNSDSDSYIDSNCDFVVCQEQEHQGLGKINAGKQAQNMNGYNSMPFLPVPLDSEVEETQEQKQKTNKNKIQNSQKCCFSYVIAVAFVFVILVLAVGTVIPLVCCSCCGCGLGPHSESEDQRKEALMNSKIPLPSTNSAIGNKNNVELTNMSQSLLPESEKTTDDIQIESPIHLGGGDGENDNFNQSSHKPSPNKGKLNQETRAEIKKRSKNSNVSENILLHDNDKDETKGEKKLAQETNAGINVKTSQSTFETEKGQQEELKSDSRKEKKVTERQYNSIPSGNVQGNPVTTIDQKGIAKQENGIAKQENGIAKQENGIAKQENGIAKQQPQVKPKPNPTPTKIDSGSPSQTLTKQEADAKETKQSQKKQDVNDIKQRRDKDPSSKSSTTSVVTVTECNPKDTEQPQNVAVIGTDSEKRQEFKQSEKQHANKENRRNGTEMQQPKKDALKVQEDKDLALEKEFRFLKPNEQETDQGKRVANFIDEIAPTFTGEEYPTFKRIQVIYNHLDRAWDNFKAIALKQRDIVQQIASALKKDNSTSVVDRFNFLFNEFIPSEDEEPTDIDVFEQPKKKWFVELDQLEDKYKAIIKSTIKDNNQDSWFGFFTEERFPLVDYSTTFYNIVESVSFLNLYNALEKHLNSYIRSDECVEVDDSKQQTIRQWIDEEKEHFTEQLSKWTNGNSLYKRFLMLKKFYEVEKQKDHVTQN